MTLTDLKTLYPHIANPQRRVYQAREDGKLTRAEQQALLREIYAQEAK